MAHRKSHIWGRKLLELAKEDDRSLLVRSNSQPTIQQKTNLHGKLIV